MAALPPTTMSLRTRGWLMMAGLLVTTLVAVWTMATGGVLQPLMDNLQRERVEVAVHIAEQVERAERPRERFRDLTADLGVTGHFARRPPPALGRRVALQEVRGREVHVSRRPGAPITVAIDPGVGRRGWLVLAFPADLDAPMRRIAMGLAVLGLGAIGLAVLLVQWMLRPLELASSAMERAADGDLRHRAPSGSDAAGRMGATFNRMADRVEGLIQGQRDLMAAVSHELRTPLTRMRLHTELMREAELDASAEARLDSLEKDIEVVDGLVEELLESARLEKGVLALQLAPTDLHDLAAEALGSVPLGDREVRLEVPPGQMLLADRRRLLRVLTNLLSNVARYTPADCSVAIRSGRADGETWLEVSDDGPGVAASSLPRLFDPFFREEVSRSRETGGLGLGLMLCRQIARAHGGRIVAANSDKSGLKVRITLPTEGGQVALESRRGTR